MAKKTIWFMKGYANLYHAISDIKMADKKKELQVLCTHPKVDFCGFISSDFHEVEPKLDGKEFIDYCFAMVKKYKVNVIIASNKQKLLSQHEDAFKALGVELAIATNHKTYDIVNNKGKLYEFLKTKSFVKIPEYSILSSQDNFLEHYHKMKNPNFELCVKPTIGVYGNGYYALAESEAELQNKLGAGKAITIQKYSHKLKKQRHKILLMRYLEGSERSIDCLAYHGKLIGGVSRIKYLNKQIVENNPSLMKQVEQITQALKLNGMFNIQFKDSKKEHFLLEINPRMSGRSYYATMAGLNLPYLTSLLFSGLISPEEISFSIDYNLVLVGRKEVLSNEI